MKKKSVMSVRKKKKMASKNHIHKYRRQKIFVSLNRPDGYIVYACDFPDCTHYIPPERVLGRDSICNKCGRVFTMTRNRSMLRAIPHCENCKRNNNEQSNE